MRREGPSLPNAAAAVLTTKSALWNRSSRQGLRRKALRVCEHENVLNSVWGCVWRGKGQQCETSELEPACGLPAGWSGDPQGQRPDRRRGQGRGGETAARVLRVS